MVLRVMTVPGARSRVARAMFALAGSALALLLFALHTSPLFPDVFGGLDDSALFLLVGKGMAQGKVCYLELFDHKGPVMFILQALGYMVKGRTGVWMLECLACAATFFTAWETLVLLNVPKKIPLISGALLYLFLIGKGNLTEEFSVPLVMLCLFLAVRWITGGRAAHPPAYGLIYGASFAALCLMKVTNAPVVAFIILWAFVSLARARLYKNLFTNLAAGVLGIALVAAPIFLWFYVNGALDDMLYATFVHNFYYARINAHAPYINSYLFQNLLMYVPVVYAVNAAWRVYRRDKTKPALFVLYVAAMGFACLLYVNRYTHYFLMFVPVFILAIGVAGKGTDTWMALPGQTRYERLAFHVKKRCGTFMLAFVMAAYAIAGGISIGVALYEYAFGNLREKAGAIADEARLIPPDEKSSVIGYQIPSSYYLEANIMPCYKYFTFQEWYSLANPRILDDFVRYIGEALPLWVITLPDEDNTTFLEELDAYYECVQKGRYMWLYRLLEQDTVTIRPFELEDRHDEHLM
jgi:hypothetical protein